MPEESWDRHKLSEALPKNIAKEIASLHAPIATKKDHPFWTITNSCLFSCKLALQELIQIKNITLFARNIWHKRLTFKISFFRMRLLHKKLHR